MTRMSWSEWARASSEGGAWYVDTRRGEKSGEDGRVQGKVRGQK